MVMASAGKRHNLTDKKKNALRGTLMKWASYWFVEWGPNHRNLYMEVLTHPTKASDICGIVVGQDCKASQKQKDRQIKWSPFLRVLLQLSNDYLNEML